MERLLVLRLECIGITAEAMLNGIPLARINASPEAASVVTVPIHEYTIAGGNHIELVIEPPPPGRTVAPKPLLSNGRRGASLRLLLPRIGQVAHPSNARLLGELDWAPHADDVNEIPLTLRRTVELPIGFPRWRWLDAPVIDDTRILLAPVAAYLQDLALGLARGDPEPLLQAARLRLEDLARAYQQDLVATAARWRAQIQQLHARQPLEPTMPTADALLLRPVAGGRLLECLDLAGEPVLRSPVADGGQMSWPLRLAAIDGKFYVLR
jgi:hypothetical protein